MVKIVSSRTHALEKENERLQREVEDLRRLLVKPIAYQLLASSSGLTDTCFKDSAAAQCYIPIKARTRLLSSALRLAQEALWNFARRNWPDVQHDYWLEGPEEVEFGRDHLISQLGEYAGAGSKFPCNTTGRPWYMIRDAIFDVVPLRNSVAHPRFLNVPQIDCRILISLKLAVMLNDAVRARKLKKLRAELQAEAERALADIERYEPLALLPGARPWAPHHERLFRDVILEMESPCMGVSANLPEIVKRIALKDVSVADPRVLAAARW